MPTTSPACPTTREPVPSPPPAPADAPIIYLGHAVGRAGDNILRVRQVLPDGTAVSPRGLRVVPDAARPCLLVSFAYIRPFLRHRHTYRYRSWALDSGAYSVHASGKTVDVQAYIALCHELLATDDTLDLIFALDVIGDWRASERQTEAMWKAGIPAVPCYHVGEPWELLQHLAASSPKIAIGGAVRMSRAAKHHWTAQCFARVWPTAIHGFGYGGADAILAFPFHSVDATNWTLGPTKYGQWRSLQRRIAWRGSKQDLSVELQYYLQLERLARHRWRQEMAAVAAAAESYVQHLRRARARYRSPDLRRDPTPGTGPGA